MLGRFPIILVWSVSIFMAIWVDRTSKRREWGIFGPNRSAIAQGSWGEPGFFLLYGSKINWGMPRRLRTIPVWSFSIVVAIWVEKQAKRWEWGIFRLNQSAIDHGSRGGPGIWAWCGKKIDRGMLGRLGIIPPWFFQYSWSFCLTNRRNDTNRVFLVLFSVLYTSVVHLNICGYLGWQTSEMPWTGHFQAKSVCYSPKFQRWAWV